jgi:hypothetical protein
MGLNKDLKLVNNDFSNIATFLFVGLLAFEIPNSKTLSHRFPFSNPIPFFSSANI